MDQPSWCADSALNGARCVIAGPVTCSQRSSTSQMRLHAGFRYGHAPGLCAGREGFVYGMYESVVRAWKQAHCVKVVEQEEAARSPCVFRGGQRHRSRRPALSLSQGATAARKSHTGSEADRRPVVVLP